MLTQVVRRRQLEKVGVECGHRGLDVVEQVGLLHVAAINLHRDLFEELGQREFVLDDIGLEQLMLDNSKLRRKSLRCLFCETVSSERIHAVV